MTLSPSTLRLDLKCGKGAISKGEKCHKGPATTALTAGAIGLGVGLAAVGAGIALTRGKRPPRSTPSASTPGTPSPSTPPQLPGSSPRGLLSPAALRKSKTQRMRENTAAAAREARGRIAQTAREEVRRIAQIGNTMAATGEATGMATKTAFRELRLRTEAARRRFEPGYRAPDQRRLPGGIQPQLPESGITPERLTLPFDPRTGQPRRRRVQGFGRSDSGMQFLHTQYIDPARQ